MSSCVTLLGLTVVRFQQWQQVLFLVSGGTRGPRHRGDEGLRLLHGLEANLATSLQTPQEA